MTSHPDLLGAAASYSTEQNSNSNSTEKTEKHRTRQNSTETDRAAHNSTVLHSMAVHYAEAYNTGHNPILQLLNMLLP
jgi:hypothetical protein